MSHLQAILHSADGRTVVDALLQTTPSIAVIADQTNILRVSAYACDISGLRADELEGLPIERFFALVEPRGPDGRRLRLEQFPLVQALQGRAQLGREGYFRDNDGERIPIVSNVAPFLDPAGEVIGAITSVTDLRAFRALELKLNSAIAEKEMLHRELAHRVKNHLQVLSGLVALEGRNASPGSNEVAERIGGRLRTLAAVYAGMDNVAINAGVSAAEFIEQIVRPYSTDRIEVRTTVPNEATLSSEQAASLGMLLNEAVCNSFKHAFPGRGGQVGVVLSHSAPERMTLEIWDDGVGFDPEAPRTASPSQGVRLMRLLAGQLGGDLAILPRPGGGVRLVVNYPA